MDSSGRPDRACHDGRLRGKKQERWKGRRARWGPPIRRPSNTQARASGSSSDRRRTRRCAWPAFDVSAYTASIDYDAPAARIQMTRKQVIERRARAARAGGPESRSVHVSGTAAWNVAAAAGGAPAPQPQPAAVEERTMEVRSTPQGFVKAALANNATSQAFGQRFRGDVHRRQRASTSARSIAAEPGREDPDLDQHPGARRLRSSKRTFSDYRDFNGTSFRAHIVRQQGGYPVLGPDGVVGDEERRGRCHRSPTRRATRRCRP